MLVNKISIIVSVYNEESVLEQFFQAFEEIAPNLTWEYELLFVNDGSTDRSKDILKDIADKNDKVRVINFSRNFGHEAAMIAGIDHASGDALACLDADLQHPLEYVPAMIKKIEEGYDVITMNRKANKDAGIFKNITSKMFYRIMNVISSQTTFAENASDFFAIDKKVADVLRSNYREKTRFLRGYIQSVGFAQTSIEYTAADRAGGKSHYSIRKLFKLSAGAVVGFSDLPLKLGIYTGFISALLGLIVLIYTLFTCGDAPNGYATIVVLLCFLFAAMFMIVGIIGQYIAVVFAEIKDRPIYIIDED